ncbi:MAG: GAF domain-containing protein [Deltaproteobacteria bacterium]|nr:GAF domain-containing protein [Deltaproteobacteria bacterium]
MKEDNHKDIYHRELDTILRFCALINSSLNIDTVLDNAMKWAEEFMDAEASSIYELDEERDELFIRLARGEKTEPIKGIKLKVGEGISGSVVQTGRPEVIQDVRRDKRFSDKFDRLTGFKTRAMICVPLILRDTPFGALQVLNKKTGGSFTRSDLELLVGMSQQIAVAMENARLYQRLEKKFELTEQELKTTQEKLIRSERLMAMGHLVQGVAHEIRNPITTIGGFARRIKKALNEDNRLNEYIDIIVDESARLEKLVNEVREFADAQSASLSLDSIVDVMNEVSKKFKPLANRQDVKFEMDIAEDTPLINMDMSQLVSAMSNIIENALESMPDGGTLALKVIRKNDNLLIAVRDTGCGIAGEQLEAVYDPFVTSKTRGAGLGLTMVHQIIMNHHGDIKISSDLDKGTLVTIRLPIS